MSSKIPFHTTKTPSQVRHWLAHGNKRLRAKYAGVVVCSDQTVLMGGKEMGSMVQPQSKGPRCPPQIRKHWVGPRDRRLGNRTLGVEEAFGTGRSFAEWIASLRGGKSFRISNFKLKYPELKALLQLLRPKTVFVAPGDSLDALDLVDNLKWEKSLLWRGMTIIQMTPQIHPGMTRPGRMDEIIRLDAK